MATHASVLAWKIPGTEEPGGLPSMGSHRVGHDWSNLIAAAAVRIILLESYFLSCHLSEYFSPKGMYTHIKTKEGYRKRLYRLPYLPIQLRRKLESKRLRVLSRMCTQSVVKPILQSSSWFLVWYIIHYSVNRKIEVISMQRKTNELCHCRNVLHGFQPSVLKLRLNS